MAILIGVHWSGRSRIQFQVSDYGAIDLKPLRGRDSAPKSAENGRSKANEKPAFAMAKSTAAARSSCKDVLRKLGTHS